MTLNTKKNLCCYFVWASKKGLCCVLVQFNIFPSLFLVMPPYPGASFEHCANSYLKDKYVVGKQTHFLVFCLQITWKYWKDPYRLEMHQEAEQGLGKFQFIDSNFKIGPQIKSRPDKCKGTGLFTAYFWAHCGPGILIYQVRDTKQCCLF